MEKGVPIRVITRTLQVLKAINRDKALTMTEIARQCDLPYPTTCRIVQTLLHEGIIEMADDRKRYRPTALAQSLSYGYQEENAFAAYARPYIVELTRSVGWPITIATRVADYMVIRDSTHSLTTMTFSNYYPGYTMPIFETASGKVHLAFCPSDEFEAIIASARLKQRELSQTAMPNENTLRRLIADIRRKGYATNERNRYTLDPGKTSSISVPLQRNGQFAATLTIIFFSSALSLGEAVSKYLQPLLRVQADIDSATRDREEHAAAMAPAAQ